MDKDRLIAMAREGLAARREQLQAQLRQLDAEENELGASRAPTAKAKRKSNLTAAGRKRLSQSMKKRWAERRKVANKVAKG